MASWLCSNVEAQLKGLNAAENIRYDLTDILKHDHDSISDSESPRDWTRTKKALHILPVALLCLSTTTGSSIVIFTIPQLEADFGISRTVGLLTLSLYVLGLTLGPVIAAPIADKWGRATVYKYITPVFIMFTIASAFVNSFVALCIFRTLAGMAGSPCLAMAAGTVTDLYARHKIANPLSCVILASLLGLCLGPIIGGVIVTYQKYHWTLYFTAALAILSYATVLPTSETDGTVLSKGGVRQVKSSPSQDDKPANNSTSRPLLTATVLRPICMLVLEPIVLLLTLYNTFIYAILSAFLSTFPYVFAGVYSLNSWQSGLTFLVLAAGLLFGAIIVFLHDRKQYQRLLTYDERGRVIPEQPEQRLYPAMLGAFFLPLGLILFALTSPSTSNAIMPILAFLPFGIGSAIVLLPSALYIIDTYGPLNASSLNSVSALAAISFLSWTMGAAFPLFTGQMYDALGTKWATLLLGLFCLIMLPVPFVLFRWGPGLRKRSRYATLVAQH